MATDEKSLEWFLSGQEDNHGVALVIHGLNLKPSKMSAIIGALTNAGIDVLNLSLCGHGANFVPQPGLSDEEARLESFRQVTYDLWQNEVNHAYERVIARSKSMGNAPVFLVGFSLGAVMGCVTSLAKPDINFDKIVLFAPPLAIHWYSYIFKLLFPFPRLIIPSASPAEYRTNRGTSIAAYSALYAAIRTFSMRVDARLQNTPTLVFVDQDDELVSYQKLTSLLEQPAFQHWQMYEVAKRNAVQRYHHLVIDAASVGDEVWQSITARMLEHLL